jgi:23S rRNA (uracil1939-C5)-methyltransferase
MRRKARPDGGRQVEVTIQGVGSRGDGYAEFEGRPLFVAQTLEGDRVRVKVTGERPGGHNARRGELLELIEAGPGRCEAPCPHFGPCGGCGLQHLEDRAYAAWKRGQVLQALERRGLDSSIMAEMVRIPPGTRRRAVLRARQASKSPQGDPSSEGQGLRLGFYGRDSHRVEDLRSCLILTPGLLALIPPLRIALQPLVGSDERWGLVVSETETGVDLCLQTGRPPELRDREALAALAGASDLARVSWQQVPAIAGSEPEPIIVRRAPIVTFGEVAVTPPPGGFLQPSRAGEQALSDLVLSHLPGDATRVADLYSGCGTFTFRLSAQAGVSAVEGDGAALEALQAAARQAGLTNRVSGEQRDLARRPLSAEEMSPFDCVVFDPPRAGARAQAEELAHSSVPRVIAVSCNPATFARDARILVDGGYRLTSLVPVDQFPWTEHVELVACLQR